VFERYAKRIHASPSDLRKVRDRVEKARLKLVEKHAYGQIKGLVLSYTSPSALAGSDPPNHLLAALRTANAEDLAQLIEKASIKPRRKRLHLLRLKIKTIRYQEEWALRGNDPRPGLVAQLKDAQDVLGDYEDLVEFRKLGRSLELECRRRITRDWRRVRKRARALPAQLSLVSQALVNRHLRLVGSQSHAGRHTSRRPESARPAMPPS
jgi:CHAD domain-containing protein